MLDICAERLPRVQSITSKPRHDGLHIEDADRGGGKGDIGIVMPSVFISHSSKDKKFVRELVKALKEQSVTAWVDDKQIKVGQPIPLRIAEGIRRCDFFLVVLSRAATESRWVENELNSA